MGFLGNSFGNSFGILLEINWGILSDLNVCAGRGKEKFDLMTEEKNLSLEAGGLRSLALKKESETVKSVPLNFSSLMFAGNSIRKSYRI